ncbi:MAG: hypothetical protein ACR2PS_02110 [Pseudomonadales bacterium]
MLRVMADVLDNGELPYNNGLVLFFEQTEKGHELLLDSVGLSDVELVAILDLAKTQMKINMGY